MIHSLSTLISDTSYHGTEVTIRCTVVNGPKSGDRRGDKTLYELSTAGTDVDGPAFLSIWNENPDWTENFGKTASNVRDAVSEVPLESGEVVLARGIPNTNEGKWYLNVTSVLIRHPDTAVGKGEMRMASECPRIYDLAYEKNVYSSSRYDLSPGSVKGNVVHKFLEYAIESSEYRGNFDSGWTEENIETCFEEVLEQEFVIDLALCRLAWVSTNQIRDHARNAIEPLVNDEEFSDVIIDAEEVAAEVALSDATGFNGRVDLVIDDVPYDLKTNYQLSDSQLSKHRFQLRVYLFAFLLESLKPGESVSDRLEAGVEGVLVYPNRADVEGVQLERVRLRETDVTDILQLRNEAIVLREGFGTPTTYGRDCEGCSFKEPTILGSGGGDSEVLPPPCQFHCQSERRWDCFETDGQGTVVSRCPLFDECDERLEYRNPGVTDHYNQLRSALNAERDARSRMGQNLDRLDDETLVQAGLRIPGLTIETLNGKRRLLLETEEPVVPAFGPGATVRVSRPDSEYYHSATYYGRSGNTVILELDGRPIGGFLDPRATYVVSRTLSTANYPRDLLGQLDYAQRSGVSPVLKREDPTAESRATLPPDDLGAVMEHLDSEELYIDAPVRQDRPELIAQLTTTLATASYPALGGGSRIPPEDQRVLVLNGIPTLTDDIVEKLGETDGAVRMDGFADADATAITPDVGGHEIYEALESSQIIVSSLRYALTDHVFHAMESGDTDARPHSRHFFDAIVLVGAEQLTEPQFHFIRTIGDRIAAIGDVHRPGPELVSGEARESPLGENYFSRVFHHYATVDSDTHQSLQVPAELTQPLANVFRRLDVPIEEAPGTVEFVNATGTTTTALRTTTINHRVPCVDENTEARFLRLEPVEQVDALQISHQLESLRTLDAGDLTVKNNYTIQDIQYKILTNTPIDGDHHRLEVNVPVTSTPFLHRRLVKNEDEVEVVCDLCETDPPDIVVTPFVAHANALQDAFDERDIDIPVLIPSELNGGLVDDAVVSIAVADERRVVTAPVSEIETLYSILNTGKNVTIVGDRATLERNSIFKDLITRYHDEQNR